MKIASVMFLSIMVFSFTSCINNEEEIGGNDPQLIEISPTNFGVSEMRGDTVILSMEQNCGSACWADLEDRIIKDGRVYFITTLARISSKTCTLQCAEYNREYTVVLPDTGNYEFRYVISDTTASAAYVYWDGSQ